MTAHDNVTAVVEAYARAWSAPDVPTAERLLRSCWGEGAEIVGPGYHFVGLDAVLAELRRFHREQPGWSAVVTSGFDAHGRWVRFGIAMRSPDGQLTHEGWDIVELGADGLIARVITFWGPLPPLPPLPSPPTPGATT